MYDRRSFIQSLAAATAGAVISPGWSSEVLASKLHKTPFPKNTLVEEEFWEAVKMQFEFADGMRYFNNGSLGGCAIPIRLATKEFRDILDGFPSKYMWGGWNEEKEHVRKLVAGIFNVDAEEIALNHNTTEGMNIVARSFDLKKKDEVILGNHEHASGTIPWEFWQASKGVKLIRPTLPILPKTVEEVVDVYRSAITKRTKVISICHIVNTNGMMLPIKAISKMAHDRGIFVAVDGAQSAGMFNIDLKDMGCDVYTASAHKWLFAPKGIGVFYAKKQSQAQLKPLMVARGYKDKSIRRLENYNTRNLPELLGLGASVEYHNSIGGDKIHERSYELKHYFRSRISENPSLVLKTPESDDLSCAIQVVEVKNQSVNNVKSRLSYEFGIDCRPMNSHGLNALRISLAIYITKADIDFLVNALNEISA